MTSLDTFDNSMDIRGIPPNSLLRCTEPEFAQLQVTATHFWILPKQSVQTARNKCITLGIAKIIQEYHDCIGLSPVIHKLRNYFEIALTTKEKRKICFRPVDHPIESFWGPDWLGRPVLWGRDQSPAGSFDISTCAWTLAESVLSVARKVTRRKPRTAPSTPRASDATKCDNTSFGDLPWEIRGLIFEHLTVSERSLQQLSGRISDFIEPAILGLSRSLREEALDVLSRIPLVLLVQEKDVGAYEPEMHMLCSKIPCTKLTVVINLTRLCKYVPTTRKVVPRDNVSALVSDRFPLEIMHRLSIQINRLPRLQELTLDVKRQLVSPVELVVRSPSTIVNAFPDSHLMCLQNIKDLKKAVVTGDTAQRVAQELQRDMTASSRREVIIPSDAVLLKELTRQHCLCSRLFCEGMKVAWL